MKVPFLPRPDAHGPMTERAAPFAKTANWVTATATCAALDFGFKILLSMGMSFWLFSTHANLNPHLWDELSLGSTPVTAAINLGFFGLYVAILWVTMRLLHGLRLGVLVGPLWRTLHGGAKTALYLTPIFVISIAPSLGEPDVFQNMPLSHWLRLLPFLLPVLFIQIGAEELVFRGYLQSHLAALSRHPLVWMLIPSVLFGLIHYDGSQPAYSAWAYVVWATGLGLVTADVTARHGTLGPALAIHFINNISAMLVLASDDWLFGASLFVWQTNGDPWTPWVPYEALFLVTIWLAARLAIRR